MSNEKLIMALRTIKGSADQKGKPVFLHFSKPTPDKVKEGSMNVDFNAVMANIGGESFTYESFKTAYDSDPRIKEYVKDFNEDGITVKTKEDADGEAPTSPEDGSDKVSQMAKSATDVGATL
jgi:hypothetical protein